MGRVHGVGGESLLEMLKALYIVGSVMVSMSFHCCMEVWNNSGGREDWGGYLKKGNQKMRSNYWGITLCSLKKIYSRVLEREASTECQALDPEGAEQIFSWSWNCRPDLCPCRFAKGVMGDWLSNLHAFCRPSKGSWPCSSGHFVGMQEKKEQSWKAKLWSFWAIYIPTLTYDHGILIMTSTTKSHIQDLKWYSKKCFP